MLRDKTLTYISLFSVTGVGCFGFKQEGFACIATNEFIATLSHIAGGQCYNRKECSYGGTELLPEYN